MKQNFTLPNRSVAVALLFPAVYLLSVVTAGAQTPITSANTDIVATPTGNTYTDPRAPNASSSALTNSGSYTYTFGNASGFTDNAKKLKAFTAGGSGYTYNTAIPITVKIRRVENAAMTSYRSTYGVSPSVPVPTPRDLAYFEGLADNTAGTVGIKSAYIPKMENLFLTNDLTIGIDNLFANTTATNFNNIERIDVVAPGGISVAVPGAQGFALFERGIYNAHDPAVVVLITSIDANGNPLTYASKVVRIATSDYLVSGQTTNGVYQPSNTSTGNFIILRRDNPSENLKASDLIGAEQGIGGVFLTYSDFNITAGTTVYGYSVLANDFPTTATAADALDFTNSTNFPTNSSDATGAAGNDMATITGVVKRLFISGNVYNDANGLTDNLINGIAISKPSGVQLYVNLVDANNQVVGVALVKPDGSFTFDQLAFGPLTAQVSTNQGTVDMPAPPIVLPTGWGNTGEAYGINNNSGTGNEPAATANGSIAVRIGDVDITSILFGIEQRPVVTAATDTPRANPGGTATSTVSSTVFTGTDAEDGTYPTNLTGRTVSLTPATNGTLFYNGVPVSTTTIITNFNPAKLTIDPTATGATTGSGGAAPDPTFTYAVADNAGLFSNPKPIAVPFTSALPVSLVKFTAQVQEDRTVKLDWTTSFETNNKGFLIERSKDLKAFEKVGEVGEVSANSSALKNYSLTDRTPYSGTSYYRLIQTDLSGLATAFPVKSVVIRDNLYGIYPNPVVNGQSFILRLDEPETAVVNLLSVDGRVLPIQKSGIESGNLLLKTTGKLSAGVYVLTVEERGQTRKYRLVVQ